MRNNISKSLIIISILFSSMHTVSAQDKKQEVSIHIAGGLSSLNYETNLGKRSNDAGGNFGIGYSYFFIENLGLNTGVEFSSYKAEMRSDKFNNVLQDLTDPSDGETYDLYSALKKYKEEQTATYINIPLTLQFQYGERSKLYAQAGVKIGIPIKGEYKSTTEEVTHKGYFHETGNWGETQEFMGFGTTANYSNDDDIDFKLVWMITAELGMKWGIADNMFLYTGAYIDYGLNDIVKGGHNKAFTKTSENSDDLIIQNNSILNSSIGYSSNKLMQQLTERVVPISVGVKVRLALAL